MCGITSIYKENSIEDVAIVAANAIQNSRINLIRRREVFKT